MTKPFFLDVETTGVGPDARLVSYAFQIENHLEHQMVRPEGFEIPGHVAAFHGITTVVATEWGESIRSAICKIAYFMNTEADLLVCHNVEFDRRIVSSEAERLGTVVSWPQTFCTMKALTPHCKLLRAVGPSQYKYPTLAEAYKWMFNRPPPGPLHCARTDMLACREIYYAGQERKLWG